MIDLHIHSTLSDGTKTPEELIREVVRKGIKTFSITDHDNIDAHKLIVDKYLHLISKNKLRYISGVEFSADYKGRSMHILAYGFSHDDEMINDIVSEIHNLRIQRVEQRLSDIQIYNNISFTGEEIAWIFSRNNPGKPHIAKVLVDKGEAVDIHDAIDKFMSDKLPDFKVNAVDLINKLSAHNIIVGIAHPIGGEGEERLPLDVFVSNIKELVPHGISFIEGYYSLYDRHEREVIRMIADKYGLYLSGGSDYHGENKDIELGNLGNDYTPNKKDLTILKLLKLEG